MDKILSSLADVQAEPLSLYHLLFFCFKLELEVRAHIVNAGPNTRCSWQLEFTSLGLGKLVRRRVMVPNAISSCVQEWRVLEEGNPVDIHDWGISHQNIQLRINIFVILIDVFTISSLLVLEGQ